MTARGRKRGLDVVSPDDLTGAVNDGIGEESGRAARQRTEVASEGPTAIAVASSGDQMPASSVNAGVPNSGSGHLPSSELDEIKARLRAMEIKLDDMDAELKDMNAKFRAMKAAQNKREPPIEFESFAKIFAGYTPEEQQRRIDALEADIRAQQTTTSLYYILSKRSAISIEKGWQTEGCLIRAFQ